MTEFKEYYKETATRKEKKNLRDAILILLEISESAFHKKMRGEAPFKTIEKSAVNNLLKGKGVNAILK